MKLNKSFLSFLILTLFILSSCSQARYGKMTRRVKDKQRVASKSETPSKRDAIILYTETEEEELVDHENVDVISSEEDILIVNEEPIVSTIDEEGPKPVKLAKLRNTQKQFKEVVTQMPKKQQERLAKAIEKTKKSSAKKEDVSLKEILIIVLIVVLALIILGFLVDIFGPLIHLLLTILLVAVLIWLLLNLLG